MANGLSDAIHANVPVMETAIESLTATGNPMATATEAATAAVTESDVHMAAAETANADHTVVAATESDDLMATVIEVDLAAVVTVNADRTAVAATENDVHTAIEVDLVAVETVNADLMAEAAIESASLTATEADLAAETANPTATETEVDLAAAIGSLTATESDVRSVNDDRLVTGSLMKVERLKAATVAAIIESPDDLTTKETSSEMKDRSVILATEVDALLTVKVALHQAGFEGQTDQAGLAGSLKTSAKTGLQSVANLSKNFI